MDYKMKILVIEDDKYISGFINVSLKNEGYQVLIADTGTQGLFLFTSHHPDLILLDLGLPDIDGLDIITELRMSTSTPIVVISARGQEREKIDALDRGADDYLTKPFYMGELLARIRVIERNLVNRSGESPSEVFTCDYLTVDYARRRVLVDGSEVHLTPLEYKLLLLLIANQGKVLTHNYIVRHVWGYDEGGDAKTVRVFMANLRRKIERNSSDPHLILTEVGIGYRFADI